MKINYKKRAGKTTHIWRLNNMLLNNFWIKEKQGIKSYIETNEAKSIRYKNLGESSKAVLIGKFIALQVYLKK